MELLNAMHARLADTIPDDLRLFLNISARYLQELRIALQGSGIEAWYERPGADGLVMPRLIVKHPEDGDWARSFGPAPR
jgi:hypothetical protein